MKEKREALPNDADYIEELERLVEVNHEIAQNLEAKTITQPPDELIVNALAKEVAKIFIGSGNLKSLNVSQRRIRHVINMAKGKTDITLVDILQEMHEDLDR